MAETHEQLLSSAHLVFDRLWKKNRGDSKTARDQAYHWLAHKLGKPRRDVSLGSLSRDDLERTITISRNATPREVTMWNKHAATVRRATGRDRVDCKRPTAHRR